MPAIQDNQQRKQALDITSSYIVQAPAGSGKTELLSQRYLALLATCNQPEAVLAITFTRKAASEMRLRIIRALETSSLAKPDEAHKQLTWELARKVMQQDASRNWNLLANPSRLKIVTIDSFNASLTRQMPLLSKMGTSASPVEQAEALYLEAAKRTLQEVENTAYLHDLSVLMSHLGNNLNRIQQLLVSMLTRRDQWLRHLHVEQNDKLQRQALEQALQRYIHEQLLKLQNNLPAGFLEELTSLAEFAARHVDPAKKPAIALWENLSEPITTNADFLEHWQALSDLLLTDKNEPRKSLSKTIGFPAPSSEKAPEKKAFLQQQKERLSQLIEEITNQPSLLKLFAGLRLLPARHYTEQQWSLVKSLSKVLKLSAAQLRVVFSEQGQVDFSEIALAALQALGNPQTPSDLAMMLDYQLQHILVDEFQDTSEGQMELLKALTREWQPQEDKTLFLVGDPMQSIYRFREAEVGLYLKSREQGIGNVALKPLTLSVNFRSRQEIVDWVNRHLATAFSQEMDISTGAVTYSPSIAFHPLLDSEAVCVHPFAGRSDVEEARKIIEIIQQQQRANPNDSIAILARSRPQLQQIIIELEQQKIPYQGVDLAPLSDQPCIIDLYTLTRAFHHLGDRLHWLALLRAPWCGLQMSDLQKIAEAPEQSILQACKKPAVIQSLSRDGQQRLNRLLNGIEEFIKKQGNLSLRRLLECCWQQIGGYEIYPGQTNNKALQSYFDLLSQHEKGGRIDDLALFDAALEKLYAPPDSQTDGKLQLMTIHKSKGLEFDTVILPGLGKSAKSDETSLLEWMERPNQQGEVDLMMAPIKASSDEKNDSITESLRAISKEKTQHELTRLLYVALTRAKKRLHLLGHVTFNKKGVPQATSGSFLAILWQDLAAKFQHLEEPDEENELSANGEPIVQQLQRLDLNWLPKQFSPLDIAVKQTTEQDEVSGNNLEFDWASDTARHVGTITHRYLENLAENPHIFDIQQPEKHEARIAKALLSLGTDSASLASAVEKVVKAISNTLQDDRGRWILAEHIQAQNEFSLTYRSKNSFKHAIIDRTFIDNEGIRWVIDYKTGSHEGSDLDDFLDQEQQRYREQLEHYAFLISQLEKRPVRLGLYFPLLKGWREWEYFSHH